MLTCKNLRILHETEPMGIDESTLTFSYELESSQKNTKQTAYMLEIREKDGATVYRSGRVEGPQDINITVDLSGLKRKTMYEWNVTVWDNNGECASAASWFETGIGKQWEAKWIEPPQRPTPKDQDGVKRVKLASAEDVDENKVNLFGEKILNRDYSEFCPALFIRKEFSLEGKVKRARVYATAHGIYRLYLNGKRVDDREFAPEITNYKKILQYQTYDITGLLKNGENAVGIMLADGWWAGRVGISGDSCQFGSMLGALLQLEMEYEDGGNEIVFTDETWKSTDKGPYIFSDLFVGEKYDARREMPGWSKAGFDDGGWTRVNVAEYGYENLKGQYGPFVTTARIFPASRVMITPNGETVLDLGQNIAGHIIMKVRGELGTEISLEHSEVLDEHGNFLNNIAGKNKDQKDFYILKGEGEEVYETAFSYHGFRYVKIEGYPGSPKAEDFKGCAVSSNMKEIGSFECSDKRLNRLQQNIWWSQTANMISIPTDCPQREKAGWTGDISMYSPTASYLKDTDAFLRRWLDNVRSEQFEDGQVPIVIPYLSAYLHLKEMTNVESSCGWGDCILFVPFALYYAYGDKAVLEQNYDAMKKWVEYQRRSAESEMPEGYENFDTERKNRNKYLWNGGIFHYADWLAPSLSITQEAEAMEMFRSGFLTMGVVAPAYHVHVTGLLAKAAEILGKKEDQNYYADYHNKAKEAFAAEYINEDGRFALDYQGIYVIALQFGLYPENLRAKGAARLVELIRENGYRLDTGFLSVPFLLDVLCREGYTDVAYKLLYQDKCPSWLYEVKQGATTMWEAWQAIMPDGRVTNLSYNHYAFGSVGKWIYENVGGLKSLEPGYAKVQIRPSPESGLNYAKTVYDSAYGRIAVRWEIKNGKVLLETDVPCSVNANIMIPALKRDIQFDWKEASSIEEADGYCRIKVGSGKYALSYPV